MSDKSITSSLSSGLRSLGGSIRDTVSGLFKDRNERDEAPARGAGVARPDDGGRDEKSRAAPPASGAAKLDGTLLSKAADEVMSYASRNQPLFQRAERYGQRAERLSGEGASSETASNKAVRAREEILAGLAALRASFVNRNGEGAGAAFDHESEGVVPNPAQG